MNPEDIAEFEHLWTKDAEHYLLWQVPTVHNAEGCLIYDKRTGAVLIIDEDDELADAVEVRMKEAGVPIVKHVPERPMPENVRMAMALKESSTKKWWLFWK